MRSGPFAGTARGALSALVRSQDPATGLLGGFARGPAADRPLCNHGPALEALAEAYGLDYGLLPAETRTSLERTIARAVEAALAAQLRDGSFGYTLRASRGDTSVTLLVVRGLEAARRAGFEVDPARLRLAGKYVASRVDAGGRLGYVEPGDRATDATLAAEALPLADALGLPGDLRARMAAAVAADQAAGGLEGRLLFRSAFLDVAGRTEDPRTAALGPAAARGTIDGQEGAGSFASGGDRYARVAGDALSTARVVRALTSPYRRSR
jgi:hypothetical protein